MSSRLDRVRLEVSRSRRPFGWMLWLFLCAAIATWVIFKNQTFLRPWSSYDTVRVSFSDVKGVLINDPVRIAGVDVGVVSGDQLIHGRAVLTLSVNQQYGPIYRNARFRLRPQTPLEDMYVQIETRGTPKAGRLGPGAIVPAEQTITPVDVSSVLNTFSVDTRLQLSTLLDELGKGLGPAGAQQLRAAFVELVPFLHTAQAISTDVASRQIQMRELIHQLGALTAAIATRDRQLTQLVTSGDHTLATLAANDQPLSATLHALPPTLSTLNTSFSQIRAAEDELDPAFTALMPAAEHLSSGLIALDRFSQNAQPALRALQPALPALTPLVSQLEPTAQSLLTASRRLIPQAPQFNTITRALQRCLYPTSKFLQWSLSVFKFSDAAGDYARANSTIGLDSAGGVVQDPNEHPTSDCAEGGS